MPITLSTEHPFSPEPPAWALAVFLGTLCAGSSRENIQYPLPGEQERPQLPAPAEGLLSKPVPERGLAGASFRELRNPPSHSKMCWQKFGPFHPLLTGRRSGFFERPF